MVVVMLKYDSSSSQVLVEGYGTAEEMDECSGGWSKRQRSEDDRSDTIVAYHKGNDTPMQAIDIHPGWKYVEVAGAFDPFLIQGGGGFLLRNWDDKALVAQAFPSPGNSLLFVQAYALHEAMKEMVALRQEEVVFCLESEDLFHCFYGQFPIPDDIRAMLQECRDWWTAGHFFHVVLLKREQVEAAEWLACLGRRSQQHCQYSCMKPWPPGLADLL